MPPCRSCGRHVASLAMWLQWRGYGRTCARREGIRPVRPRPADAGPGQLELDLEETMPAPAAGGFELVGFDEFDGEDYPISTHPDYDSALRAARERLAELEATQPSVSSGGQGAYGIQDRVFVVHPGGMRERIR